MIKPLDIESEYADYVRHCYPFGVKDVQRTEMRRVFYAGVHLLLCHMLTFDSEIEGDRELERLLQVTKAFGKSVGRSIHHN